MRNQIERGQPPEVLFSSTKLILQKHLLPGSLIPNRASLHIRELVGPHMRMVNDDTYTAAAREAAIFDISEDYDDLSQSQLLQSSAMFQPGGLFGFQDRILVRESLAHQMADTPRHFLGVLLEEVAHGFASPQKEIPFTDLQQGSRLIAPFTEVEDFVDDLNSWRRDHLGLDGLIDLSNLSFYRRGFMAIAKEHGSTPRFYPPDVVQYDQEEARALILHTIFHMKVLGSLENPYGSLNDQLTRGLTQLRDYEKLLPDLHQNVSFGLEFVAGFHIETQQPDLAATAKLLTGKLYESDCDEFLDFLGRKSPQSQTEFESLIEAFGNAKVGSVTHSAEE